MLCLASLAGAAIGDELCDAKRFAVGRESLGDSAVVSDLESGGSVS